jgi:hypothetical protein
MEWLRIQLLEIAATAVPLFAWSQIIRSSSASGVSF